MDLYVTISEDIARYDLVTLVRLGELIGQHILEDVEERYDSAIRGKYLAFRLPKDVSYADLCWIAGNNQLRLELLEALPVDADGNPAEISVDGEDEDEDDGSFRW